MLSRLFKTSTILTSIFQLVDFCHCSAIKMYSASKTSQWRVTKKVLSSQSSLNTLCCVRYHTCRVLTCERLKSYKSRSALHSLNFHDFYVDATTQTTLSSRILISLDKSSDRWFWSRKNDWIKHFFSIDNQLLSASLMNDSISRSWELFSFVESKLFQFMSLTSLFYIESRRLIYDSMSNNLEEFMTTSRVVRMICWTICLDLDVNQVFQRAMI